MYTKGPWIDAHYSPCGRCVIPIVDANAQTPGSIAVCYGPDAEDNARLIAAAPELLEALEELYINACDRDENVDENGVEYADWRKAWKATSKARGEK